MSHFDSIMIDLFAVVGAFVSVRFLVGKMRKGWRARRKQITLTELKAKWQGVAVEQR